jgi:hypothetical protein
MSSPSKYPGVLAFCRRFLLACAVIFLVVLAALAMARTLSRDDSFNGLTISKSQHDGIFMAQAAVATAWGWQLCPNTQCNGNSF